MRDSSLTATRNVDNHHQSVVILLHGIGRTYRSMRPIEKALTQCGYKVVNLDYPSRKKNIQTLAKEIYPHIHPFNEESGPFIHFVTHSMGGLVVRQLLAQFSIANLGRIIMIAPPNQGSEIADFLKNNFLFKLYYGAAGQELCTTASKTHPKPFIKGDLGIIAGQSSFHPLCNFVLPAHHDGKVSVQSTKLTGMKDHIVIHANHTFIMRNKNVIQQIKYFLEHACFLHH
ncbi:MAG: alpha/beta hydrolase [Gammaproteobacteria bacterium]|jgi:pimeloyl-ACP methyl ester carboxylesterase|nr:alpha/beta hydrolase [Gammaproteobacteria bacterium]